LARTRASNAILKLREVTVARINRVSPGFASITFQGEALADFTSLSFDDHVKFMFNDANGEPVRRDYTPRRFDRDAREIDIEFALHGHGGAAEWARNATVSQRAVIGRFPAPEPAGSHKARRPPTYRPTGSAAWLTITSAWTDEAAVQRG